MRSHRHEIVVTAPPEAVWAALVEFDGWARWNTLTAAAPDGARVGAPLLLRIRVGSRRVPARATFVAVEPERRLVWEGGPAGLFRAVHGFDLHPSTAGCRVVHHEVFTGALVGPVLRLLGPEHPGMYERVNVALKRVVEA